MQPRVRAAGPWPWISEPILELPGTEERRMFGCRAYYRGGRILLVLTGEGEEPWNGVCACVEWDHHAAMKARLPALDEHPVLGKWLYVSSDAPGFETTALALVRMAAADEPLLGVVPKPKRRKSKAPGGRAEKQKSR